MPMTGRNHRSPLAGAQRDSDSELTFPHKPRSGQQSIAPHDDCRLPPPSSNAHRGNPLTRREQFCFINAQLASLRQLPRTVPTRTGPSLETWGGPRYETRGHATELGVSLAALVVWLGRRRTRVVFKHRSCCIGLLTRMSFIRWMC